MRLPIIFLALTIPGLPATGQARPTATGPGFQLPTLGGTLRYSLSASESLNHGLYSTGLVSSTNVSGNAAFLTQGLTHPFSLIYSGGYLFSNSGQPSPFFQNLAFSQAARLGRWEFIVSDSVSYLPQTPSSGLSGVPGVGDVGIDPVQIGPASGFGILTGYGPHVNNSVTGSASRMITGRLSFNGSGSQTILRYLGNAGDSGVVNGIDSTSYTGSGGMSYRIDARNTAGGSYNYSTSSFGSNGYSFSTQSVSGFYSRQWTRRLSTSVSGGPLWVSLPASTGGGTSINLSAGAGITYTGKNMNNSLNYLRGTGTGSGVIPGAISDSLVGGTQHTFGRTLSLSGSLGYARTKGLPGLTTSVFLSEGVTATAQASRAVGRRLSAFASYTVARQSVQSPGMTSNAFGGLYQVAGFGVTYSPGPIHLGPR